jgi:hypothetical protein
MNSNNEGTNVMPGLFALSVASIFLALVVIINLGRMFYTATPKPPTSDYGYFGDPSIDPAFVTRSQPAYGKNPLR